MADDASARPIKLRFVYSDGCSLSFVSARKGTQVPLAVRNAVLTPKTVCTCGSSTARKRYPPRYDPKERQDCSLQKEFDVRDMEEASAISDGEKNTKNAKNLALT